MNVAVFGLGKLGLPLVAALASKGHEVVGVDKDEEYGRRIERYIDGVTDDIPGVEPDVLQALSDNCDRLGVDRDSETAVIVSDVVFVVVPTPSKPTGEFSTEYVMEAAATIGKAMYGETRYILVVLVSTVMPGDTAKFVGALERHSGRFCRDSFGVCYNPEFVALGSVLHDLLNPDFVLIGESDEKAGNTLCSIYISLVCPGVTVRRMNFVNAEIANLALNCYITMKISYANLLGNLCEEIPGANAHTMTDAIGLDRRVGKECLKPATAYGGPYFPRDVNAFRTLLDSYGQVLLGGGSLVNSKQTERLVDLVEKHSPQGSEVAVLGLTYKPGTHVTEGSVGLDIIRLLLNRGREVVAWDPMITKIDVTSELDRVLIADSLEDCVAEADVVVVTIPCEEFDDLPSLTLPEFEENLVTVIDPWGVINHSDRFQYIQTGVCQKESER